LFVFVGAALALPLALGIVALPYFALFALLLLVKLSLTSLVTGLAEPLCSFSLALVGHAALTEVFKVVNIVFVCAGGVEALPLMLSISKHLLGLIVSHHLLHFFFSGFLRAALAHSLVSTDLLQGALGTVYGQGLLLFRRSLLIIHRIPALARNFIHLLN